MSLFLSYLDIRMPIMSDAKLIEKVHLRLVNFLIDPLSLGLQRNKISLPFPWPKCSMLLLVVVMHSYFGYDKL
jgi:hypothetical protein